MSDRRPFVRLQVSQRSPGIGIERNLVSAVGDRYGLCRGQAGEPVRVRWSVRPSIEGGGVDNRLTQLSDSRRSAAVHRHGGISDAWQDRDVNGSGGSRGRGADGLSHALRATVAISTFKCRGPRVQWKGRHRSPTKACGFARHPVDRMSKGRKPRCHAISRGLASPRGPLAARRSHAPPVCEQAKQRREGEDMEDERQELHRAAEDRRTGQVYGSQRRVSTPVRVTENEDIIDTERRSSGTPASREGTDAVYRKADGRCR